MSDDKDIIEGEVLPSVSKKIGELQAHTSGANLSTSTFRANMERRRLTAIEGVQRKYADILARAADINIGIGNLSHSEKYKQEALDELRQVPKYLAEKRKQRNAEMKKQALTDEIEIEELQQRLDALKANKQQPKAQTGSPQSSDDFEKHQALAAQLDREISNVHSVAKHAKETAKNKGVSSEAFEQEIDKQVAEDIENIRNSIFEESQRD